MGLGLLWATGAAAALLLVSAAGPPMVSGALASGEGAPDAELLARLFGGAPERVDYVVHGPEPVYGSLSWAEFAAWLGATALGGALRADGPVDPEAACRAALPGGEVRVACGPDQGYGDGQLPSAYCDDSSGWVAYRGAPPGSAYQALEDPRPTNVLGCPCIFFFGPCFDWRAVELSPSKDRRVLAGLAWEGCYAEVWTLHANGFCPNSFDSETLPLQGALDTFAAHWRARGVGIPASFTDGTTVFDYFVGSGARTCYDMPTFPAPEGDVALECLTGDVG